MKIFDFISAIIQHVPEKNLKLVRYYGLYSRRKKKLIKSGITKINCVNSSEKGFVTALNAMKEWSLSGIQRKCLPKIKTNSYRGWK